MFKQLYAIARHTSLTIMVTPAGDKLSLIILPKPSGTEDKALQQPIKMSGTPEELDSELPAQLEAFCTEFNGLVTDLGESTEALKSARARAASKPKKKAAAPAKASTQQRKAKPPRSPRVAKKKPAPAKASPAKRPVPPKPPKSARTRPAAKPAAKPTAATDPGDDGFALPI